jgi:dihydroxy-acid dehydratase
VLKYLMEHKLIDGDIMTVNGRQLGDNLDRAKPLAAGQDVIRPLSQPIKSTGHLRILKGNIAPGGCVSKITGKEGLTFRGKARVFDNEDDVVHAIETKSIKQGEKTVIVLRYLGPKGGPGMPEMLKTTSMVMGAGLGLDVACVTDGRFSGGTHGFTVGHVVPEAFTGGNIALIEDGDVSSLSPLPVCALVLEHSQRRRPRRRKRTLTWTFSFLSRDLASTFRARSTGDLHRRGQEHDRHEGVGGGTRRTAQEVGPAGSQSQVGASPSVSRSHQFP